jgi:hypothetical protein
MVAAACLLVQWCVVPGVSEGVSSAGRPAQRPAARIQESVGYCLSLGSFRRRWYNKREEIGVFAVDHRSGENLIRRPRFRDRSSATYKKICILKWVKVD